MYLNKLLNISFFNHFRVKFFSFLCAIFLWFYVVTDNVYEYTFSVPLKIKNQPSGWILTEEIPEKVRVRFKGTGKNFLSLEYSDKVVEIDLKNNAQTVVSNITMDMIKGIPADLNVTPLRIVEPDSVLVRLDKLEIKKVPVKSNLDFNLLNGYTQVGNILFDQDSIVVSGPRSIVTKIRSVYTKKVEYKRAMKRLEGKVELEPSEWSSVHYSNNMIRFSIDIQRIGEVKFSKIPIKLLNVPDNIIKVKIIPSTLSLKMQGGVNLLRNLTKEDVIAEIDFSTRYRYKRDRIPANIHVPEGISFKDVVPGYFELVVER